MFSEFLQQLILARVSGSHLKRACANVQYLQHHSLNYPHLVNYDMCHTQPSYYLVFDRRDVALVPPVHGTWSLQEAGLHEKGPCEFPQWFALVAIHNLPELLVSLWKDKLDGSVNYSTLDFITSGLYLVPYHKQFIPARYRSVHLRPRSYHVSKVVHALVVGMFAQGVFQVVELDLLQVLLPHHSPPALLFLQNTAIVEGFFFT